MTSLREESLHRSRRVAAIALGCVRKGKKVSEDGVYTLRKSDTEIQSPIILRYWEI